WFEGRLTRPAYFMPLRDEDEPVRSDSPDAVCLPVEVSTASPAPWAAWFERKAPTIAPQLVQALAFLGWLHRYTVAYQTGPAGRPMYGIGGLDRGDVCWLGSRDWHTSGKGRAMGEQLWRTFLDAGGPWPTEFCLRAAAREIGPTASATDGLRFFRA